MFKTTSLLCFAFAALPLLAFKAEAKPVAAFLYPGGAVVHEEVRLQPEADQHTVRLYLHPDANPATLDLAIAGNTISSLAYQVVSISEADLGMDRVLALRQELNALRTTYAARRAAYSAQEASQKLWANPPLRAKNLEDIAAVDAALLEKLPTFNLETLRQELALLEAQTQGLEAQLQEMGAQPAFPLRQTQLVTISLEKPASSELVATYSYNTPAAGWQPTYRLNALPTEKTVALNMGAEMWQSTGVDWANVNITLLTINPRQDMAPPQLLDWLIQPQRIMPRSMPVASGFAPAQDMVMAENKMSYSLAQAPQYSTGAAYAAWELGPRALPTGPKLRLPLASENLAATFNYTVRPSRSTFAYLSATLSAPSQWNMPTGTATLLVDNVVTGETLLSLTGTAQRLFFGRDPLVSATLKQNIQQSGKEGLISKSQTYVWDWTITVENQHKTPVTVQVEEPQPQSRDERIALEVTSTPKPTISYDETNDKHILQWLLTVPAQSSATIQHKVNLSAPTDMPLNTGR